jgi:hypothetical protein
MGRFSGLPRQLIAGWVLPLFLAVGAMACRSAAPPMRPQLPPSSENVPPQASVSLFREVLSFKIESGKAVGQGFYYFRNPDAVARAFPTALQFFVSKWQGLPQALQLAQISPEADDDLPYVWLDPGCPLTQILVPPRSNYCLRVDWEQPLSDRKFVYVLRRESPWNLRRDLLRLTILVPSRFRNVRMNCRPSFKFKTGQHRSFVIVRENFEPTEDLVVTWEE